MNVVTLKKGNEFFGLIYVEGLEGEAIEQLVDWSLDVNLNFGMVEGLAMAQKIKALAALK